MLWSKSSLQHLVTEEKKSYALEDMAVLSGEINFYEERKNENEEETTIAAQLRKNKNEK